MTAHERLRDVRNYIQNERDTILRRWMALEQAVKSEDFRRENFFKRKLREDSRTLPLNIQKFVEHLRNLCITMRDKGRHTILNYSRHVPVLGCR